MLYGWWTDSSMYWRVSNIIAFSIKKSDSFVVVGCWKRTKNMCNEMFNWFANHNCVCDLLIIYLKASHKLCVISTLSSNHWIEASVSCAVHRLISYLFLWCNYNSQLTVWNTHINVCASDFHWIVCIHAIHVLCIQWVEFVIASSLTDVSIKYSTKHLIKQLYRKK